MFPQFEELTPLQWLMLAPLAFVIIVIAAVMIKLFDS